jgi:iron complex outermembrane receptor protein
MAFDDYTLSKFICFATQSGSIAGAQFSNKQQKSSYQNYFTSRFFLSEKLHLETGLAFNTTRYSCEIFCSSGNNPDLAYTFGKYGHREQDSPIDLLKQDDLCVH